MALYYSILLTGLIGVLFIHEFGHLLTARYYGIKVLSQSVGLALQLPFLQISESMGNHDSKIVDAASVD